MALAIQTVQRLNESQDVHLSAEVLAEAGPRRAVRAEVLSAAEDAMTRYEGVFRKLAE